MIQMMKSFSNSKGSCSFDCSTRRGYTPPSWPLAWLYAVDMHSTEGYLYVSSAYYHVQKHVYIHFCRQQLLADAVKTATTVTLTASYNKQTQLEWAKFPGAMRHYFTFLRNNFLRDLATASLRWRFYHSRK